MAVANPPAPNHPCHQCGTDLDQCIAVPCADGRNLCQPCYHGDESDQTEEPDYIGLLLAGELPGIAAPEPPPAETPSDPRLTAYNALYHAAERMARSNAALQPTKRGKRQRSRLIDTPAINRVVDAMPRVLSGKLSPHDAMALLWEHDVLAERLASSAPMSQDATIARALRREPVLPMAGGSEEWTPPAAWGDTSQYSAEAIEWARSYGHAIVTTSAGKVAADMCFGAQAEPPPAETPSPGTSLALYQRCIGHAEQEAARSLDLLQSDPEHADVWRGRYSRFANDAATLKQQLFNDYGVLYQSVDDQRRLADDLRMLEARGIPAMAGGAVDTVPDTCPDGCVRGFILCPEAVDLWRAATLAYDPLSDEAPYLAARAAYEAHFQQEAQPCPHHTAC